MFRLSVYTGKFPSYYCYLNNQINMLTKAEGKACYMHILNKIDALEKTDEWDAALQQCNKSMVRWMIHVYPLLIGAYMDAVKDYGYPKTAAGLQQFQDEMDSLRDDDEELSTLGEQVRNKLIPCMRLPPFSTSNSPKS